MALSTPDILYVRQSAGDTTENAYEISDEAIQSIYDSTTQGNSDLDRTIYYVIRRRYGLAVNDVSSSSPNTQMSVSANQRFEQLERLLNLWARITGLPAADGVQAGTIATGFVDLGIDTTETSLREGEW